LVIANVVRRNQLGSKRRAAGNDHDSLWPLRCLATQNEQSCPKMQPSKLEGCYEAHGFVKMWSIATWANGLDRREPGPESPVPILRAASSQISDDSMSNDHQNPNQPNTPPYLKNPTGQPPFAPYAPPSGTQTYQTGYPVGHYPQQGDGTGGLIPYKNPLALISYYVGVASLIPCIGPVLGLASITLAVLGLMAVKKNPIISGTAHAWVGIALSLFSALYHVGIIVFLVVTANTR
jgi:hypothetical protein